MDNKHKNMELKEGDYVFATVRGFPSWPAKISKIEKKNTLNYFHVCFYGTYETARCSQSNIYSYQEHKNKLGMLKKNNNKFNLAIQEIEREISNKCNVTPKSASLNSKVKLKRYSETKSATPLHKTNTRLTELEQSKICSTPEANINASHTTNHSNSLTSLELSVSNINIDQDFTSRYPNNEEENICASLMEFKWVTDDTVQMYFDLLNQKILPSNIFLMNPVIAVAIINLMDIRDLIEPLEINRKDFIIIPINNTQAVQHIGKSGTHWSLMLLDVKQKMFYYFDSLNNINFEYARILLEKLKPFMKDARNSSIVKVVTPQQKNGNDCGIYMMLVTDIVIPKLIGNHFSITVKDFENIFPAIEESDVINKRAQLAMLYHNKQYRTLEKKTVKELMFCKNVPVSKISQGLNSNLLSEGTLKSSMSENEVNESISKPYKHTSEWTQPRRKNKSNINNQLKKMDIQIDNQYDILYDLEENVEENSNFANTTCRPTYHGKKHLNHKQRVIKTHSVLGSLLNKGVSLSLYSDSQGRGMATEIMKISKEKIKTLGTVMPNASLLQVTEAAKGTLSNVTVLIGGTNDTQSDRLTPIYEKLEEKLVDLSKDRPVIITTVPKRYDLNLNHPIHMKMEILNNYIRELVIRIKSVHLIDLDHLKRYHFSSHGLHLNRAGKLKISYLIVNTLNHIFQSTKILSKNNKKETQNSTSVNSHHTVEHVVSTGENKTPIQITTADMNQAINKYCTNDSVAFAHCISQDFDSKKHMSQGVAVVFKNRFGGPLQTDYIKERLAFKKTIEGACVYSLITKENYYDKPKIENYDIAFQNLTEDFIAKGFKHLVCSPLGCVRDSIPLEHFSARILQFHQVTKATVEVITCDENVPSTLRRGLPFYEFLEKMKQLLITQPHLYTETATIEMEYQQSSSNQDISSTPTASRQTNISLNSIACLSPRSNSYYECDGLKKQSKGVCKGKVIKKNKRLSSLDEGSLNVRNVHVSNKNHVIKNLSKSPVFPLNSTVEKGLVIT